MATTEVGDILTMVDCIEEANVYGVKVEGKLVYHHSYDKTNVQ